MKKTNNSPLAIAIGSTLVSGIAATAAHAETPLNIDENPFTMSELSAGYMQTAAEGSGKMKDGACGEGKCGSAMQKGAEEKTAEGNCAGNKPMPKATKNKSGKNTEGKCGEGKCGSSMSM